MMARALEVIRENLDYTLGELPGLDIDEALRAELGSFCMDFKADLETDSERIRTRIEELHEFVMRIRDLESRGGDYQALSVLFNESGANILTAYMGLHRES